MFELLVPAAVLVWKVVEPLESVASLVGGYWEQVLWVIDPCQFSLSFSLLPENSAEIERDISVSSPPPTEAALASHTFPT